MTAAPITTPTASTPRALAWTDSPVGPLVIAASDEAVCRIEFSERERLEARLAHWAGRQAEGPLDGNSELLAALRRQLAEYFGGARRGFDLPLAWSGSPFQEKVWSALLRIPYGETWSYGDLALEVGDRDATRAVGGANHTNPIAIVVPCHRVINAGGGLGGYGGGAWRKRLLLDLECGQGQLAL